MIDTKIMKRKSNIAGWLLAIPSLLSFCCFILYPIIMSVYISFTNWRFFNINVSFNGLENYKWLFDFSVTGAGAFWHGIYLSFYFTFISTIIQTVLGFIVAFILYSMGNVAQKFYRVIVYLPVVLPMTMVSVMFTFFLQPNGLVDYIFTNFLGVSSVPKWLATDGLTMWVVIFINTWRFLGITVIIYFVAMNTVDKHIIESAHIDGCGGRQTLLKIILPITWSSTKINLLLSIMGGLKSYDFFYVLTNGLGDTEVVGMYIFKTAFEYRTFSRAVVMSLFLTVIIGSITFMVNKLAEKGERV